MARPGKAYANAHIFHFEISYICRRPRDTKRCKPGAPSLVWIPDVRVYVRGDLRWSLCHCELARSHGSARSQDWEPVRLRGWMGPVHQAVRFRGVQAAAAGWGEKDWDEEGGLEKDLDQPC